MRSRLSIILAGILAGVGMSFDDVKAQQIESDTDASGTSNTGTSVPSGFPTAQSNSASTNTASATPPLVPPTLPPPLAPTSELFAPAVPYGGETSQTGEALAQSLQQQSNQPYNLKIGPVQVRAEADVTAAVNDNIGLTKDDRVTDFTFLPMGILHGRWTVSDLNTVTFNIGVGYQAYLLNPQYDSLIIAPDSEVNFNFFIGDCTINLHDTFSYEQDPTQIAQLSNQVRLSRFLNDAGVSAKWDLDDVMVEADYDHNSLWVLNSSYDYLSNQSDTFAPTATWKIDDALSAGLQASFTDTRYEQSFQNDSTNESLGPFVEDKISKFLSVDAAFGGFLTQYSDGGGNGDSSSLESYYANFGINHEINQYLSESLTGGKQYVPGLTSNYTQRLYLNYGDQWSATKEITLADSLFWENLSDSDATTRENSNRYGVSLTLNDALTEHLNVNLGYQFLLKDSDPTIDSYVQNVGTLGMQYNF